LDRRGDSISELCADLDPQLLLEQGTQHVEVPVVVVPKQARRMAAPSWHRLTVSQQTADVRMVYAGPRLEHHAKRCRLLRRCQGRLIGDAQFGQRLHEVEPPSADMGTVQSAQKALAHRTDLHAYRGVAPLRNDSTMFDNESAPFAKAIEVPTSLP
jgi:hypothetical protein